MQKVDLPTSFTKLNENCGLPDIFTDYQIRHLGNPSGLPEILLKIDPWRNGGKVLPTGSSRACVWVYEYIQLVLNPNVTFSFCNTGLVIYRNHACIDYDISVFLRACMHTQKGL